ncbi:MAG: saccharopine dehydrogenase NADP-binding domain-containing protein [Pseudomonadota bacterium]
MPPSRARKYDVIIWGATGFTGSLVAAYFAEHYGGNDEVRWAVGGRDKAKLSAVLSEIGAPETPMVIADAADPAAMSTLAGQTKVVLTTVGPYQKYGSQLVAACAAVGTDYVDLCGEPPWMRRMIDAHHEEALASGARIVHSCGFDSIPFDLGVYFLQSHMVKEFGAPARDVKGVMLDARGGFSGGTAASLIATVEAAGKDREVRRTMGDWYALAPSDTAQRPKPPDMRRPRYDRDAKSWLAPFIMADINARNVHRTNLLTDFHYGEDFTYIEMMVVPNALAAGGVTGAMGGFAGAMALPPLRALIKSFALPKPGEGPDKNAREKGYFKARFIGVGPKGPGGLGGAMGAVRVDGKRDPGYGATSRMIAESAVCLAKDITRKQRPGGVLTPAAAMGATLIDRLERNAGLTFAIDRAP